MPKKKKEEKDKSFKKWLEEERTEEKNIIDAQLSVKNKINNFELISYKFSNIHEMIKRARLIKGYTQNRISSAIGINRSTYSRYENGERQIPNKIMDEILNILNLKIIIQHKKKSEIDT